MTKRYHVTCTGPDGSPARHVVEVSEGGHVSFPDHAGEDVFTQGTGEAALAALAGNEPTEACGCYCVATHIRGISRAPVKDVEVRRLFAFIRGIQLARGLRRQGAS